MKRKITLKGTIGTIFSILCVTFIIFTLLKLTGIYDVTTIFNNKIISSDSKTGEVWKNEKSVGPYNAQIYVYYNLDFDCVWYEVKSDDKSNTVSCGYGTELNTIRKFKYKDVFNCDFAVKDDQHYFASFVPLDCDYVIINNKSFDVTTGEVNVGKKNIPFKICFAMYKSTTKSTMPEVLQCIDIDGKIHNISTDGT